MRTGRAARAVLALLLAVLLAACTDQPAPPPEPEPAPPPEPSAFVVGVDALGPGFNPHLLAHQSPVTTALASLVLPSVFRPGGDGELRLDTTVATSAEVVSGDPFTVSYELNVDASWSSNAPIAAEDFVYLWEQMRSQPGTADAAGYQLITQVRSRAGGKAVDVLFAEPYPGWQHLFADLLPAHILKDAPGSWTGALAEGLPASGGPFRIGSVDRARGEIVLARNDLYWATPAVLDQVALRRLDTAAIAAGLSAGDVDLALPMADGGVRAELEGLVPAPRLQPSPRPVVIQLGLRADAGPLADPRVRQAVGALLDREAVRAAAAPEALAADAFGSAPSESGYTPSAPAAAPARPDPAVAAQLLVAAGWLRDSDGRWTVDGEPVVLVAGAAAESSLDLRVAELVAAQLDAAGIAVTLVAPAAVELFGQETVTAQPPPTDTAAATPGGSGVRDGAGDAGAPSDPPGPTPAAAPNGLAAPPRTPPPTPDGGPTPAPGEGAPGADVQIDLMVLPRRVGGDPATEIASAFGCPLPSAMLPDPAPGPTGFCFPPLQPLLDQLLTRGTDADLRDTVERVLWAQVPALPLFQPVDLVVSTPDADAATGVGPGPLRTGPLTGAQRWQQPTG